MRFRACLRHFEDDPTSSTLKVWFLWAKSWGDHPRLRTVSGSKNRSKQDSTSTLAHRICLASQSYVKRLLPGSDCGSSDGAPQQSNRLSLLDLPTELLTQVMNTLPTASLWSLRQSSSVFMSIFELKRFHHLHGKPNWLDRHIPFAIELLTPEDSNAIKKLIRKRDPRLVGEWYCPSCTEVRERDDKDARIDQLLQTSYCTGCQERHASIFFSEESLRDHEQGSPELVCLGIQGQFTVCPRHMPHKHKPVTWDTIVHVLAPNSGSGSSVTCKSHIFRGSTAFGSPYPRMAWGQGVAGLCSVAFGWECPMILIDQKSPPSLKSIRIALTESLTGALEVYRTCRHLRDGRLLREFAHTGICSCFSQPNATRRYKADPCQQKRGVYGCKCLRDRFLDCPDCGGIYGWHLEKGQITLVHRYTWLVSEPTSPAWLNMLDQVQTDLKVLGSSSQHLLWCDTPGCAMTTGRAWDDLVKQEIFRRQSSVDCTNDRAQMESLNIQSEFVYRIPDTRQHLLLEDG